MSRDIKEIITQMTLEEKVSLLSGVGAWNTRELPRYGIPSIMMTDGPHGLRKQVAGSAGSEHMGIGNSVPTTCFPAEAGLACSWNRELVKEVGKAIGEECQTENVQIILGPGVNIKRSPLCGRNFEYYSEDPFLSSHLAAKYIEGVQSEGVGTSLKHFAANNQETKRLNINDVIDERTFREIYLTSFEWAVKEAKPWMVMSAYNKINGEYCSQNRRLLTDILKDEWGFDGFVVSDWFGVSERVKSVQAGLELEMPSSNGVSDKKIIHAVQNGSLGESAIDKALERLLKIIFKAFKSKKRDATYNKELHHMLARKAALESIVLLKNEENLLPLDKRGEIALIGALAKNPRYQGSGSSRIVPTRIDKPYEEIQKIKGVHINYAAGYSLENDCPDPALMEEAKVAAQKSDAAIIFAGLPDNYDSEGKDRKHLRLPESHNALIDAVAQVQKNIIVVLLNGSAVEMPWLDKVKGVFEAYLGGQAMGNAIISLLFGDSNPCAKLAETFPQKLQQTPAYINFPGDSENVEYREGIFVGYRYYDKVGIRPLFPFGHGLSYTKFEYSDINLNKKEMQDTDELTVSAKIKNTGNRAGKEIVQLYVRDIECTVIRPEKELKAFEKIELEPGEEKAVTFKLGKRAFAYYNVELKDWYVESGKFEILIGKSSRDILLSDTVIVNSTVRLRKKYTLDSTFADIMSEPAAQTLVKRVKASHGSGSIPLDMDALLASMKLRMLSSFGGVPEEQLEVLVEKMNES